VRVKFFPLLVVVLVCSAAAVGQTVVEAESTAAFDEKSFTFSIVVDNGGTAAAVPMRFELLDTAGDVVASRSDSVRLAPGRNSVPVRLPVDAAKRPAQHDIAWYRLRYKIGSAEGIVSLSQLLRDLFELRITATDNLISGMNYRVRVRATNPFSGLPAAGVEVDARVSLGLKDDDDQALKLEGRGRTDADGFAVVDLAVPVGPDFDGDGEIVVEGRRNGIVREATEDLQTMSYDTQFLLMTDKPIYQPEQTMSIRGILLKGVESKTVLSDSEVEFRITDEDNTVLYREKVKSSAYGIAAITWSIPVNAKLGQYRIEVRSGEDQIGGRRVKVSRYDLPNFSVRAKATKPYYLPRENTAEVEVRADYLFGKPVTKGKVRVVEETSREWNWKEQKYDIEEGQVKSGETDKGGTFTARFDLKYAHDGLDEDDWRRYRDIRFAAYFTDLTTNRTEQRRFDIRVTREPIHVYFIGDTYDQNSSLPVRAYVSTFYADGTPAECDVEVRASVEDQNKFRSVLKTRTNSLGVGRLLFDRPKIGDRDDDLDLKITARDKKGNRGTWADDVSFDEDDGIEVWTDRSIYKPGDTVKVNVLSTVKNGPVYVDLVNGWSVIDSQSAQLQNGRAEVSIPYSEAFKGELKVTAYLEHDDEVVRTSRGIIFPSRQGLKVDAAFDKASYKPNEEATLKLGVLDELGRAVESALGIVVLDKAVEERAATDDEFGGMWRDYSGWLGYGSSFGGVNVKDLNELDLTKPISDDMQLVAEVILHDDYYNPNIFHSTTYDEEAKSVFAKSIEKQFAPMSTVLTSTYAKGDYRHPVDGESLRAILRESGVSFDDLRDPWGMSYRADVTVEKTRDVVSVTSAGPDKHFGAKDDFTAFTTGFEYFTPIGKKIDAVVQNYYARTGEFIRDEKTLLGELGTSELLDRFGRPYKFVFDGEGRFLLIKIRSAGKDGKLAVYDWSGDDFYVWTSRSDYFADVEKRMSTVQASLKNIPKNEAEFRGSLKNAGINFDELRDGYGNPLYITVQQTSRYWDKVTLEDVQTYGDPQRTERRIITPVTQQVIQFTIRSRGEDGKQGTYDDLTLTQFVHVISEQAKDDPNAKPKIRPVKFVNGTGSIAGVVTDPNGAVIPGAAVTAKNASTDVSRSVTTNDSGDFLISNLTAGSYSLRVTAAAFKATVVEGVKVNANSTTQANVTLDVGTATATVDVTSSAVAMETTTASASVVEQRQIATLPKGTGFAALLRTGPAGKTTDQERSTPRLREYFPETLYWQPEIVTNESGQAELKFRMADNITTWKMYSIASTKNGKVGVADTEVTAFQSFFVDLDPPKFLTEGDEIWLPTQIRNYTDMKQKVDVTMDKADWFTLLGGDKQQVDVATGASQNAVFGFKVVAPVTGGKQRVTAIAQSDSDAIEKPVTVRPNGEEIVRTDAQVFRGSADLNVDFPANALAKTQRAELKIYPNLFSHVAESVEGLLERPYGCGEQTISSTYPNLMILKFVQTDSPLRQKAAKYLQKGYERLLGYQVADGGFTYWGGKDTSDIALTAYALRFLNDAKEFVEVDEDAVRRAEDWLVRQQRTDGSWTKQYSWERSEDSGRTKLITTYVARSLAMRPDADKNALQKALGYLKQRNAEIDEPYALALYGLASLDAGDTATAKQIAGTLEKSAIAEGSAAYWNLETNTPFYGWGTAGRIETTALVVQLLTRVAKLENRPNGDAAAKGLIFMLKNKDRYGVWYSTQTTINVLDSFLAVLASDGPPQAQTLQISVNGASLPDISVAADRIEPVVVDLAGKLSPASNKIEVRGSANSPLMAQTVASHYIDWRDSQRTNINVGQSKALRLDYRCDKPNPAVMEDVTCSVEAERVGFKGYGMLLAEIGTPPGADVSRESLEAAIQSDWSLTRYDVLPDRIILYMWSKAGGTKFNFKFRPRYAIDAQTPASIVYDYYNPEAHATVAPLRFAAK
jgi:hypothetical protein